MTSRLPIPIAIQREILFEARHRCAVCCEPTPLERAHILAWNKSKDHSAPNLIALCANCHTRADTENWGAVYLQKYKANPCALAAHAAPVVSPEQQAIIDLVVSCDPETMTAGQRLRFTSMIAAYAGVQIGQIQLLSVSQANSSRIRLQLPATAAMKLQAGFDRLDPLLAAFLEDFVLQQVEQVTAGDGQARRQRTTDISERGLETLIMRHMTGQEGIQVQSGIPSAGT